MPHEVLLSRDGHARLKKELEELKGPVRSKVAADIREAKSHGDLRENAAYHEAKLNSARLESRIADLEKVVQSAKIVDRPHDAGETAHLESKVTLEDKEFGDEFVVTLVGSYEADPAHDFISIVSPLGEALLGKVVGDEIEVDAPGGTQQYKIKAIS
jgi:transcription elongation factor GreA